MTTHALISYVKSLVRIVGFIALVVNMPLAALTLIVAEVIGIYEEVGH